jgi:hypothetical protein
MGHLRELFQSGIVPLLASGINWRPSAVAMSDTRRTCKYSLQRFKAFRIDAFFVSFVKKSMRKKSFSRWSLGVQNIAAV